MVTKPRARSPVRSSPQATSATSSRSTTCPIRRSSDQLRLATCSSASWVSVEDGLRHRPARRGSAPAARRRGGVGPAGRGRAPRGPAGAASGPGRAATRVVAASAYAATPSAMIRARPLSTSSIVARLCATRRLASRSGITPRTRWKPSSGSWVASSMASVRRERSPALRSSWPTCRSRVRMSSSPNEPCAAMRAGHADRAPAQQAVVAAHQAQHQLAGRLVGHLAQQAEGRGDVLGVGVHHEAADAAGDVAPALRVGQQGDRGLVPAQERDPARPGELVDELVAHGGPGGRVEVDALVEAEVAGQPQPVAARGAALLDQPEELVEVVDASCR